MADEDAHERAIREFNEEEAQRIRVREEQLQIRLRERWSDFHKVNVRVGLEERADTTLVRERDTETGTRSAVWHFMHINHNNRAIFNGRYAPLEDHMITGMFGRAIRMRSEDVRVIVSQLETVLPE